MFDFSCHDDHVGLTVLQGIWEPGMDGTDVNAVDKAKGLNVLIAGTDRSKVCSTRRNRCLVFQDVVLIGYVNAFHHRA